jgi:hypothetical protein
LLALDLNDPVYLVGLQYYTTRKKISDITRELQVIAPWLTVDEARKRVRWCLEIFRAKVFLSARKLLVKARSSFLLFVLKTGQKSVLFSHA